VKRGLINNNHQLTSTLTVPLPPPVVAVSYITVIAFAGNTLLSDGSEADDEVVKLLASDPRLMEVLKRALKKL
jgi:hypothetical protein